MREFREGGYNTLVSTCIGEEGLDIGDVDLIVCFDAHKSPIRLVQRMGRTGRKRHGRIVMLVTEGKEEQVGWTICHFTIALTITATADGSVAEWLACWTQAQKGLGSNCSRDPVG